MSIRRGSLSSAQSVPEGDYAPSVSRPTNVILLRLEAIDSHARSSGSFLLEELLGSLRDDRVAIQTLQEALSGVVLSGLPEGLAIGALRRCTELLLDCEVIGASHALRFRAPEKAAAILNRVLELRGAVPQPQRPLLLKLFVSLAWLTEDGAIAESAIAMARELDSSGQYIHYLEGVSLLLKARTELACGRADRAVRLSQSLDRESQAEDPLRVLALELQSDAFRQMGDLEREQGALEDWENVLRALPNGPCDLAVIAETTGSSSVISGGGRSEEILRHFSRLAELYESDTDSRGFAKGIYKKFLNTAHHHWVDPSIGSEDSIEKRLERLMGAKSVSFDRHHAAGTVVVDPDRSYGRVVESSVDPLLDELESKGDAACVAIVVGLVDMKERQFRVSSGSRPALDLLCEEIQLLLNAGQKPYLGLIADEEAICWRGQATKWITLAHGLESHEMRSLSFALKVEPVGDRIELSMHVLARYPLPLKSAQRAGLSELLRGKLSEFGGFAALQDVVLELVKRAARRVEQKATGGDSPQDQKGPIRL